MYQEVERQMRAGTAEVWRALKPPLLPKNDNDTVTNGLSVGGVAAMRHDHVH